MLHIYYGFGKGKTSTLNGSAIRGVGANMRVAYFKFLKGVESSEDNIIKKNVTDFKSIQSSKKFVIQMNLKEKNKTQEEVIKGMEYIKSNKEKYDLIIMDELIDLVDKTVNLITIKQLNNFLNKLKDKEVMISGHNLPKSIKNKGDLITFFKAEKHYYDKKIKARKGIEF